MTFAGWMTVVGALLLTMALSSAFLRHLPISTSGSSEGCDCGCR